MGQSDRRRLKTLDAMVLIAATAAGFTLTRVGLGQGLSNGYLWEEVVGEMIRSPPSRSDPSSRIINWLAILYALLVMPLASSWTLAALALQVGCGRPWRRRFGRQPGAMASLAAGAVLGLVWLVILAHLVIGGSSPWDRGSLFLDALILTSIQAGVAVAWSWIAMAIAHRWRPEATWLDRFGRLLGIWWIAAVPLNVAALFSMI